VASIAAGQASTLVVTQSDTRQNLSVAWDWIPPTGTAAVGLAGIAATYFSGARARRDARVLAQEQREQQRRSEAYIELLTMCLKIHHYLQGIDLETGKKPDLSEFPDNASQVRARALVVAYGSEKVRTLYGDWLGTIGPVRKAHILLKRAIAGDAKGANLPELQYKLHDLVSGEEAILDRLGIQIAAELGGIQPGLGSSSFLS